MTGHRATQGDVPPRTLAVWCPDWPVLAAVRSTETAAGTFAAAADLPARPVAVVFANRVVACSAAARTEGVRRGQRRREAQSRVPELELHPHDPARDARLFEPVAAAVEAVVPGVEVLRPGLAVVAAKGATRYFGTEARLARVVAAAVRATGHESRLGIADGSFPAMQAAYSSVSRALLSGPPGLPGPPATAGARPPPPGRPATIVATGAAAQFLASLPVQALEDDELADLLGRLGVTTLGAFAALPADDVLARFGPDGRRRHALARGLDERAPTARTAPPELTVATTLDPPVERVDAATFAAKPLAEQLADRLARRALACTRIRIEARTEHGEELARVWRHDDGFTTVAVAERVRWQLDGWLSGTVGPGPRPTAGITLLRLVPVEIVDAGRQLGLWGDTRAAQERVERAVDRVLGLLGPEAVATAVLAGSRDIADRVRLAPWGEPRDVDPADALPWPGRLPSPSPATVFTPPVRAELTSSEGVPIGVTGRFAATTKPARLAVDGDRAVDVVGWAGPWPTDTRWWDAAARRRRARFHVLTADDRAWLLAIEDGRWWAEAAYD